MMRRLLVVVVNTCADILDRVLSWWIPGPRGWPGPMRQVIPRPARRDDTMDVADAAGVTYVPPVLPTPRVPAQGLHPCMRLRLSDESLAVVLDEWSRP